MTRQYTKAIVEHYGGTKEWDAAEEISQEELRIGENGGQYTKAEFVEHFRGTEEWDAAMHISQEELRVGEDGGQYTKAMFVEHYGGTKEWDAAEEISQDKKRRESHVAAKDRRRLKKRERLDTLKGRALPIPAGWTTRTSTTSGKQYFHHRDSGQTSWIHPASDHTKDRRRLKKRKRLGELKDRAAMREEETCC